MDIILIPGLWLDGSSWQKVVPVLEQAGHRTHALTLPGMESKGHDRSHITLRDWVGAVVAAIDSADPAGGKVLLVGHSAGAGIAYAALDARPGRVARVVYIGGFPAPDGRPVASGFVTRNGEIPLPDWSDFDEADLRGLDDRARAAFRARAIPVPAHLATDPQRLSDERRYAVPVTVVCPEFTSKDLQEWMRNAAPPVAEIAKAGDVEYVDLPTGHWPQFSRPDDLARVLLGTCR